MSVELLASLPEVELFALNLYHEARGEGVEGMLLVGMVVWNRMITRNASASGVILAPKQFSWVGKAYSVHDIQSWVAALRIAILFASACVLDSTGGATYYNTVALGVRYRTDVTPLYFRNHVFY